jgi:hypothetical protein
MQKSLVQMAAPTPLVQIRRRGNGRTSTRTTIRRTRNSRDSFVRKRRTIPMAIRGGGRWEEGFLITAEKEYRFKMDCCEQRKMWRGLGEIVKIAYQATNSPREQAKGEQFRQICSQYMDIFATLNQPHDMDAGEIDDLQLRMDTFVRQFDATYGRKQETNYIHAMGAAHFAFFLTAYGSLYKLQNIGLEGLVKIVRTYAHTGTQHGGHSGNQPSSRRKARAAARARRRCTTARAMQSYLLRRAVYQLSHFPIAGGYSYIVRLSAEGKLRLKKNAVRTVQQQARIEHRLQRELTREKKRLDRKDKREKKRYKRALKKQRVE